MPWGWTPLCMVAPPGARCREAERHHVWLLPPPRGPVPWGWTLASLLVFRKVRRALGLDRCRFCMTAAAPIMRDTLDFFMSLDVPILEIYGMSETTGMYVSISPS